jgi:hypothetical protein
MRISPVPTQGSVAPRRLAVGQILLALAAWPAAAAPATGDEPVGRYQMVTLPALPGTFASRVMILDTRDGHLWQWWETPAVGSGAASTGITYLGKVAPGGQIGDPLATGHGAPMGAISPKRDKP